MADNSHKDLLKNVWVPKQYCFPRLGGIFNIYCQALALYGAFSSVSLVLLLWNSYGVYMKIILPWFNLWWFTGIMSLVAFGAMMLVYSVLIPSSYAWTAQQAAIHQNPRNPAMESVWHTERMMENVKKMVTKMTVKNDDVYDSGAGI